MAVTEAPQKNLDGYAYPYNDKKGTYLVVHPPIGAGKAVQYEEIERHLKQLNIGGVDFEKVKTAVSESTGMPVWILNGVDPAELARQQEEDKPLEVDKSQFVFVTVSEDAVTAKLTIVPPEDRRIELTIEDMNKVIQDAGITYGINEDRLAEASDVIHKTTEGEWNEPWEQVIAQGVEPQHGQDGRYEFFFDETKLAGSGKGKLETTEDGRVDYFGAGEIENTKRGMAVAARVPPTRGMPGRSVKGDELPARDGSESLVTIGRGIEHALGNENIFVASVDGQVKFTDNKLEVLALYEVQGDVDVSTRSIDFIGSVVVRGNVQPGLYIKAGEDVVVDGVVDDAEITAVGKVTVKGGVLGQGGKAKIVAGGEINAKYIRNATIESKGNVVAHEGILHSKVSGYSVKLSGKRGQIVGGEIMAETEIVANTIGSNSSATATILHCGENPARRAEVNSLSEQIRNMETEQDKAKKASTVLKQQQERVGTLPPEKKELLMKLTRAQFKAMNDLKPLQERLHEILGEEEAAKHGKQARIAVMGTIYPGVKISIRNAKRTIVDEQTYVSFTEKGSEIKAGPFR